MSVAFLTLTNLGANAVQDMMLNADQGPTNLRFIKRPSKVTFGINAVNAGDEYEVFSGGRNVVERSRLSGGATAGVMPALDSTTISFLAATGEILEFRVRELGGVATTDINLIVDVTPIA